MPSQPPRERSSPTPLWTAATILAVSALLVLLSWTLLTDASRLKDDFRVDTWLIEHQALALRQDHAPSLFLTAAFTAFHPIFAFYGGTLFVLGGAIALVVGSAVAAQVILYMLALAAAYGGWLWLARMAGIRSWRAHAPAVLYVTAPYVLSNVYVRQDLAELVATAMIPPLLASAISILRADHLQAGPAAALAMSTIILSGSHNLTLLWGTTLLSITALALAAGVPQVRQLITTRGMLRIMAVAVPAILVNAWYLVPDLAYHSHTVIAHRIDEWKALLERPGPVVDAKHLFTLGRPSPISDSKLSAALPLLAMVWVVVVAAMSARAQRHSAWWRTIAILSLGSAAVLVVMRNPGILRVLPDPWLMLQFSYRLETFVLFAICGAVIAALAILGRDRHQWLTWLLLPIVVFSIVGAAAQVRDAPRAAQDARVDIDGFATFGLGDYADMSARPLVPDRRARAIDFQRVLVKHGQIDLKLPLQPGQVIYTNLMTPPQMISVQGASVIGRWAASPLAPGWQRRWQLALQIDENATPGQAHVVIREAQTLPIVGGKILSILGLLGLAAHAVAIGRATRRRRRLRSRPDPVVSPPRHAGTGSGTERVKHPRLDSNQRPSA
jgi:hypothetical protein